MEAPIVISNADLKETLLDLIPAGSIGRKTVQRVRKYEMSPALGIVFLGVRRDLKAEGVPNTNFELMTIAPPQPEAWKTTADRVASGAYHRDPEYRETKRMLADRLIGVAERVFPGLSGQIAYCEVATPLTHSRITHSTGGTGYGIALIPSQVLLKRPRAAPRSKVYFSAAPAPRRAMESQE